LHKEYEPLYVMYRTNTETKLQIVESNSIWTRY